MSIAVRVARLAVARLATFLANLKAAARTRDRARLAALRRAGRATPFANPQSPSGPLPRPPLTDVPSTTAEASAAADTQRRRDGLHHD